MAFVFSACNAQDGKISATRPNIIFILSDDQRLDAMGERMDDEGVARWKNEPIATGQRFPSGFGDDVDREVFYGENQGDWVGSGRITHV